MSDSRWTFEAAGDSRPGDLVPPTPSGRRLHLVEGRPVRVLWPGSCVNDCSQGRRPCAAPQACRGGSSTGDTLKGALVGAALALLGVLAMHWWAS